MIGGVNFGFWSHLGSSGQTAIIFILAVKVSSKVPCEEIKIYVFLFLKWSLLGIKKAWPLLSWSPLGVKFKISDEHPYPLRVRVPVITSKSGRRLGNTLYKPLKRLTNRQSKYIHNLPSTCQQKLGPGDK